MQKQTRMNLYNARISFRLPQEIKDSFINKCESQGEHYQIKLRELILDYLDTPIEKLEEEKRKKYLKYERVL